MNSESLNAQQVAQLLRIFTKQKNLLARLTGRMQQKHFPHNDALKMAAEKAEQGIEEALRVIKRLAEKQSGPPH